MEAEKGALGDERAVAAIGVHAAIVSAIMGKKVKALTKFTKACRGDRGSAASGDSGKMSTLRDRIHGQMNRGAL